MINDSFKGPGWLLVCSDRLFFGASLAILRRNSREDEAMKFIIFTLIFFDITYPAEELF